MNTWIRRILKSKTMNWGHIQVFAGAISTVLAFVNPQALPDLPVWVYTVSAMIAGFITYILRNATRLPLSDKKWIRSKIF